MTHPIVADARTELLIGQRDMPGQHIDLAHIRLYTTSFRRFDAMVTRACAQFTYIRYLLFVLEATRFCTQFPHCVALAMIYPIMNLDLHVL